MRKYKVGLGIEGIVLEAHIVEAPNMAMATREAYKVLNEVTNYGQGPKFYSYMDVKPVKKEAHK